MKNNGKRLWIRTKCLEKKTELLPKMSQFSYFRDKCPLIKCRVDLLASINNASIERRTTNYAVDERSTKEIINDLTMQSKEKDRQLAIANQRGTKNCY